MFYIIKNKRLLLIAFILFIASMALNFPFPHDYQGALEKSAIFNITITTLDGVNYIGVFTLLLLIASLYLFGKSLKRYHARSVFTAILLFMLLPVFLVPSYQKTFATDIYAVSYDRNSSQCEFTMNNETQLIGVCELVFKNHASSDVQFTINFYEKYWFENDKRMLSLMNNDAPYEVELRGKQRKKVKIETVIDVTDLENHTDGGNATDVHIIINSEKGSRKL